MVCAEGCSVHWIGNETGVNPVHLVWSVRMDRYASGFSSDRASRDSWCEGSVARPFEDVCG